MQLILQQRGRSNKLSRDFKNSKRRIWKGRLKPNESKKKGLLRRRRLLREFAQHLALRRRLGSRQSRNRMTRFSKSSMKTLFNTRKIIERCSRK
jgi:hypothetical protein